MLSKALIMIDYINDIIHPQGKIASCAKMVEENGVIAKCNAMLDYARKNNWLIIWIIVGFSKGYPEIPKNSPLFSKAKEFGALQLGEWGTQIIDTLNYHENELIIVKHRVNPFYATNLELILRRQMVDEIFIAGVSTQMAVESISRDGHDRDFQVTILKDLCASGDKDGHEASLRGLTRIARIIDSGEIVC